MKFISRYYLIATLLSVSVLLETLCYTYVQESGSVFYYSSSVVYALAGLAICILPLISAIRPESSFALEKYIPVTLLLLITGFLVYYVVWLAPIFKTWPVDKHMADMLPSILAACRRFLHGRTIYGPAPEVWPKSIIPYLPAMWIPFVPSEIFGYDARWTTVASVFIGIFIALLPALKKRRAMLTAPSLVGGIALFFFLNYLLIKDLGFWTMTEEGLVAGLYLLLAFALLRNNYWWIGVAITCCLLSRYTFLFWLPAYFTYVFFAKRRGDFWKLFLSTGILVSLIFILPFFIWDPAYFLHIPVTYFHADKFWADWRLNEHHYYCVGFYKFFTVDQTGLMFKLEIITSFLSPALLILAANWLAKKYAVNERYIAFGSLKMCLLFFYGFLQMPYTYLFITPTIISYVVLFDYLTTGYMKNKIVQQE